MEFLFKGTHGSIYLINVAGKKTVVKTISLNNANSFNILEPIIMTSNIRYMNNALEIYVNKEHNTLNIVQNYLLTLNEWSKTNIIYNNINSKPLYVMTSKLLLMLCTLHQNNIIHGDINPYNILVTEKNKPLLNDFSTSLYVKDMKECSLEHISYLRNYRSPEVTTNSWSYKSDVWALGCTLFHMKYGYDIFNNRREDYITGTRNEIHKISLKKWLLDIYGSTNKDVSFQVEFNNIRDAYNIPDTWLFNDIDVIDNIILDILVSEEDRPDTLELILTYAHKLTGKKLENVLKMISAKHMQNTDLTKRIDSMLDGKNIFGFIEYNPDVIDYLSSIYNKSKSEK